MKVLVCISHVPDTTTKITFTNNNTELNSNGVQFVINPNDERALSKAIELTEGGKGTVTVINVGDESTEPTIRKALAIGADDAVRINAQPTDAFFVASQIAAYAKANNFDLILAGKESIDYNGSKVPSMLGELLDIPSIECAKKVDINNNNALVEREIEGGNEIIAVPLPIVVGVSICVALERIPNMRGIMSARTKPLTIIEANQTEGKSNFISYESPAPKSTVKLIPVDNVKNLIQILHQEVKVI